MTPIIALPTQKNLQAATLKRLREAGFAFDSHTKCLRCRTDPSYAPLQVIFESAAKAKLLLECGAIQAAFMDVARVSSGLPSSVTLKTTILADDCAISLAVPRSRIDCYATDITRLDGLKIATSYPSLLQSWLKADDVRPRDILVLDEEDDMSIVRMSSDAILDIWNTDSLRTLSLVSLIDVASPEIGLFCSSSDQENPQGIISDVIERLLGQRALCLM